MLKHKPFFICVAAIFLFFGISSKSFALDEVYSENKYPDYSCEFCGKDKCEGFNRKLFVFNLKLNRYILKPANIIWASIVPKYGMDRFQNLYNNINYPVRLVSCLLQKDFKASRQETLRFLTNTTIGVAGLYDPAKNKFKLEPRQEDMGQVLAHYKCKQGPYLVLPIVRGNIRDLLGQLLDYPFKPFSYIPIAGGIANAVFALNNTTYIQPLVKKIDESYADPYEVARQIDGVTRYIKNENLDRAEIFKEKTASQNIIKISNISINPNLKSDIQLAGYNPQSPFIDSLRTAMFNYPEPYKSKWSNMSVWYRSFDKKIKISSIKMDKDCKKYNYRYILQKKKISPLAIIYPSIGEGINSDHSNILAKILYDKGYSVIVQGSAFQWEFINGMPDDYKPGFPNNDATHLKNLTAKIINKLEKNNSHKFSNRILVGTSFGALTALFVTAQDEKDHILNISRCISINPPIELMFALKQIDKSSQEWKNDSSDIKLKTAITAEKAVNAYQQMSNNKVTKDKPQQQEEGSLPFTDDEAKLIVSFIMKQKLSDTVFAIEKASRGKKNNIYEITNKMSFHDYAQKYLFTNENKTPEQIDYETSLKYISDFLKNNNEYKIYHTLDDYFVSQQQLIWLKKQSGNKIVLFSNGSHLGFLYRKEFLDAFLKDINLQETLVQPVL